MVNTIDGYPEPLLYMNLINPSAETVSVDHIISSMVSAWSFGSGVLEVIALDAGR